jgi:hypothetical protein
MTAKRPDRDAALSELAKRHLSLGDVGLVWLRSATEGAVGRNPKERDRLVYVAGRLGVSLVHARELVGAAREKGLLS